MRLYFETTNLAAFPPDPMIMRRDPANIIRVGDLFYLWYTKCEKGIHHGYDGTVWYATSPDGLDWTERGEALARGGEGAWDGQSVFTPNILVAENRYWLFYTGAPKPFTNQGNRVTKSALGLAVADSPDGPWERVSGEPILETSPDPEAFDSMRVDDSVLITRDGLYWLYYKGRQWDRTPMETKLGVAVAAHPLGPYVKHPENPVIPAGHEVMAWPMGRGVACLINYVGSRDLQRTIQYAEDGVNFRKIGEAEVVPSAAGFYRPEAFTDNGRGGWPDWGIQIHETEGRMPTLSRIDCTWKISPLHTD
ncbi:MAG: family 43 glycosylhydrolase [Verrucomicrobia bacterium]|nr:family 43 glycosylhydrolase [Verrucomicrobiota bacterium]